MSVHAGDTQTYTLTFQPVWECTATITPTLSGLPSGTTYTFSSTSLPNCTGSTTVTVSLPSNTTVASYTLSFNGTINGNPGLYPPTSAMTVVAPGFIQFLSSTTNTTYSNFNITTVGTADWAAWSGSGNSGAGYYRKAGATAITNIRTLDCSDPQFYTCTQGVPTITFTDGPSGSGKSTSTSGSSAGGGGTCHTYFDIPYTSAKPLTVFIHFGKAGNDGYIPRVTVANDFDHVITHGGASANPLGLLTLSSIVNGYPNYTPLVVGLRVQGTGSSGTITVQLKMMGDGSSPAMQAVAIQ